MDTREQTAVWLLEENGRLSSLPFSEHFFTKDADVRFYKGLPSLRMLKCVLGHVSSGMNNLGPTKPTPFQEMAVALVKLGWTYHSMILREEWELIQALFPGFYWYG